MEEEVIRVLSGPAAGTVISLADDLEIGRAGDAAGRLGDDPELSRHHARIQRISDGSLAIVDLGSTNGTYINGQRISAPAALAHGDTIRVGQSEMRIELPPADPIATDPTPAAAPQAEPAEA